MQFDVKRVKIFVTVPTENLNDVRNAVCDAGAGVIGNYTYCSTTSKSVGTFKPNEKANPYIGKSGELEFVEEDKLEFVCDVNDVKNVLIALRKTHPYEEPGVDIVPLIDEDYFK